MMNLQDTFNEIVKNEPWNEASIFFDEYESFEEIPLISRYKKISTIIRELQITDITEILVNTAFFVLNSAMLFALKNNICTKSRFFALSFTDFNLANPAEPPLPNFFIHARESKEIFLRRLHSHGTQNKSAEINTIKELFRRCHLESIFSFYESRFFDEASNEELIRVFAILRQPYLKYYRAEHQK